MNQKNKSLKTKKIIDLILSLILLLCVIVSFYFIFQVDLIPTKWTVLLFLICLCLWAILFVLTFKKIPKIITYIKRFLMVVLSVMLSVAGFYMHKIDKTISNVSTTQISDDGTKLIEKAKLFIVCLNDSEYEKIEQLDSMAIGFQNGSDLMRGEMIKGYLNQAIEYEVYEKMDYTSLYNDLMEGIIPAIAMSEEYYTMSLANIKDFKDNVRIIQTYEYEELKDNTKTKDITSEVFTVYLSGLDNVGSPDQQTRTDTNLLLIVDPIANHIQMVSLPRDGYVPNSATYYMNDKLTHTGMYGISTCVSTIENFYGIKIDYYAKVSFNSLIQIVDIIGGIEVDVEIDFCEQDENRSFKKENLICLTAGKQTLNGKQALAYSRHRKTAGYDNPGRERAQQRVIKGIINKLLSPTSISHIADLLEIIPQYVITDMPSNQISQFVANELEHIAPWTISSIPSNNGCFDSQYVSSVSSSFGRLDVYLFDQEDVQILLNAIDGASNKKAFNEFAFDFNNLYENCPQVNDDPNITWDYEAYNPH